MAVALALKIYLSSSRKKNQHFGSKTISMKFQSHALKIASFITIYVTVTLSTSQDILSSLKPKVHILCNMLTGNHFPYPMDLTINCKADFTFNTVIPIPQIFALLGN